MRQTLVRRATRFFEHRAGHGGICLADPLRDNTVIRAEHQHGTPFKGRGGIPGQGRRVLYHRFQCAQPAQRFRQCRPMCMGGSAGRFIRRVTVRSRVISSFSVMFFPL